MDDLNRAIEVLKGGGIVIFPTDTAFGIGCRTDDENAIERLFKIRKRPRDKAVPVLADSIAMVEKYVEPLDSNVRNLMEKYWPGGLTLVLKGRIEKIPKLVIGGGNTIGIRVPKSKNLLKVIHGVGLPILGPSANFAGEKTPFAMSDLDSNLISQVDFVLEGECIIKKASTVLDVSKKPWEVIREGAVDLTR